MIQLTCTQCRTVLSIDDAFAGGVCRCQHCGTIQTVPAQRKSRPTAPGGGGGTATVVAPPPPGPPQPRAVPQAAPPPPHQPAGPPTAAPPPPPSPLRREPVMQAAPEPGDLHNLAQAVAVSSGLRSGRLRNADSHAGTTGGSVLVPEATAAPGFLGDKKRQVILGAAVAVLLLLIVVIVMATRGNGGTGTTGGDPRGPVVPPPPTPPPVPPTDSPNFMSVPLDGSVVLLLDRGSGTQPSFEAIKGASALCLKSLNANVRFQVIFWQTDGTLASPESGTVPATPSSIQSARTVIGEAVAFGSSSIDKPLDLALSSNPNHVVIVTGKFGLDAEFARKVVEKAKGKPGLKVHTFAMGDIDSAGPLKQIADQTGGTFRQVTPAEMKELQDHTISF